MPTPLPLPLLGFSTYQYSCYSNKATKIASVCLAPPCLSPYPPPLGFITYQYSCYSNKATKIASVCLAPSPMPIPLPLPPLGFSTYQYSCYSNKATMIASICLAPPCLSPYPSHLWVSVLTSTLAIATRQLRLHPSASPSSPVPLIPIFAGGQLFM